MTKKRWQHRPVTYLALGMCAIGLVAQRAALAQQAPTPALEVPSDEAAEIPPANNQLSPPQDAEVIPLESGPIHEAFAEPILLDAQPDLVVPRQPPEAVPELPPEARPQGDNVVWVPGYWAWSEEFEDFIWVSGVWRDVPPGHEWAPGYWTETPDGYRWIHGFWTAANSEELLYLPAPPQSLEAGPPSPQPGPDYFYVPGCWKWNVERYAWRPGFWHPAQQSWLWIPARYCYTPRGYLFLNGYWDYPLARRGLLCAPVRFGRPLYLRSGYFFTPYASINVTLLTSGLFVSPRRGHYYFGNYYGPRFASAGYYPWFDYHNRRFGYDPLYVHASRSHRGHDDRWLDGLRQDYRRLGGPDVDGPGDRIRARGPDVRADLDGDRGPDRIRGRADTPRFVRNLDAIKGENLTRLSDEQRRQAVERSTANQGEFRRRRAEIEAQPGRVDVPFRGRITQEGASDRGPGEAIGGRSRRGGFDGNQSERSGRRAFGQPLDEQPRVDQPRVDQPRFAQPRADERQYAQPRGDQSRNFPGAGRGRSISPNVQQPGARQQPNARQPRVGQGPQQPGGSPYGRFQQDRGFTPSNRGGNADARSRGYSPQPGPGSGSSQSRGNFNRGGGGISGGGAQRTPSSRGPSMNRGGGGSPGGGSGGSGGRGNRGGSGRREK